ncbi:MAG: hypothetical protein ACJA2N_001878 [Salibacteraceae bacterium]|jgi:hypothetical protein
MKKTYVIILLLNCLFWGKSSDAQTLELGILNSFEAFTGAGAVSNAGDSISGDVGTNNGIISGFMLPAYTDSAYNNDSITDRCRYDMFRVYIHLFDLFVDFPSTHAPTFGGGETIPPGVYSSIGAGSVTGALVLDGGNDPNAYFVIKSNGAMTIGAGSTISLINGAKACNVFFIAEGAITVSANANVKGSLFAHIGGVGLGTGVTLEGRIFSMEGAISIGAGTEAIKPLGISTIPIFCESDCTPAPAVDVLGVLSNFALYSAFGAVGNTGTSGYSGNIGSDGGALSGYISSIIIGDFHNADALTAQANIDVNNAYASLMALTNTITSHTAAFGSGETVFPGVYHIASAGSLAGTITLDAQGDPDAIFVFKIGGAFSVAAFSKMILTGGARRCNVFWIGGAGVATGAVTIGGASVLKGTFLSHGGACNTGGGVFLAGRQLSTAGAVNTYSGIVYNNPECVTSTSLDLAVIVAVADTLGPVNGTTGGTNVANVLANDSFNGNTANTSQVNVTAISLSAYLTLNADGSIDVAPNTPIGTHTITYKICDNSNATNCDSAVVSIESVSCVYTPMPAITCDQTATFDTANCSWNIAATIQFSSNSLAGITSDESSTWGMAWGDYDNDGFEDLYVAEYDMSRGSFLYHNNGDGTFTKEIAGVIPTDGGSSIAGTWGDYNNDGNLDLFVANNTGAMNALYKNNGSGNFTKITTGGIANYSGYCHGASWVDYNNDGYLDMFVTDYMPTRFNLLYKNNGDGTFTQITNSALVQEAKYSIGATWADYDNDGDMDVFVPATTGQSNSLFRNNGAGDFEKMTNVGISTDNSNSVGSSWGDIDNDGDLDLFVTNTSGQDNLLYLNDGDGTFTQVHSGLIVSDGGYSSSSSLVDIDNDGDLDIYVCNDQSDSNALYINDGNGNFIKPQTIVTADLGNSYSQAWSDFDNDGDLDLLVGNHSNERNAFFENTRTNCNNWFGLKLTGTNSNRSAIGARIWVKATINGQSKWQLKEVSGQTGGGAGSQNSLKALFGLADATSVDSVVVLWPSGYRQVVTNLSANSYTDMIEGNGMQVCGVIYHDMNSNCVQDGEEHGIPGVQITIQPGNRGVTTNENGEYEAFLEPGSFTILQTTRSGWTENCYPAGHTINVVAGQVYCGNNFGNSATCSDPNLSISLGTAALRKGFQNEYAVLYSNTGAYDAFNVELSITFADDIIPLSATIPWTSTSLGVGSVTYTWIIDTVKAVTFYDLKIIDSVSVLTTVGDLLTVSANITNFGNDCDPSTNSFTETNPIVGAIDPNDILVFPSGDGEEGFIEKTQVLRYKIRFQNVGSYFAQNVKVSSEVPINLELSSIHNMVSSHEYTLKQIGNQMEFMFKDICLPDSNENEEASHGFIEFSILPKYQISRGSLIQNSAEIVFDYEDPLVTNTVINTIKYNGQLVQNKVLIQPNPVRNQATIMLELTKNKYVNFQLIDRIEVYDILGALIETQVYRGDLQRAVLATDYWLPGCYLVRVYNTDGQSFQGKLIKE